MGPTKQPVNGSSVAQAGQSVEPEKWNCVLAQVMQEHHPHQTDLHQQACDRQNKHVLPPGLYRLYRNSGACAAIVAQQW
jgi:hypothetical protein